MSNVFLSSGVMPLARFLGDGIRVGLGSDVAGAPELSIVTQMREGFYQRHALVVRDAGSGVDRAAVPGPLDWLRLGTLGGAQALGLGDVTGSLEVGKEADLIAVDVSGLGPPGGSAGRRRRVGPARLIFRERHGMVRGAWVRGRRLEAASFDRPERPG